MKRGNNVRIFNGHSLVTKVEETLLGNSLTGGGCIVVLVITWLIELWIPVHTESDRVTRVLDQGSSRRSRSGPLNNLYVY